MKRLSLILFLSLVILFSSNFEVFAQEVTASPNNNRQMNRETIREEQQERNENKFSLSETKRKIINNYFKRMLTRFEALQQRLNKLLARIEKRILTIANNENYDLTSINTSLDKAKKSLADSNTNLTALKNKTAEITTTETPFVLFKDVQDLVKEVKTSFKNTHDLLVKILGDIKGLGLKEGQNE